MRHPQIKWPNWSADEQAECLAALLETLEKLPFGDTHPLTYVEREVVLRALTKKAPS